MVQNTFLSRHDQYWLFEPTAPRPTKPSPVIVLLHGWGGMSPYSYGAWIEHLVGNPWIFQQARQLLRGEDPRPPTSTEQRNTLIDHFRLCMAQHGEEAASRMMRKFGIQFSVHHDQAKSVRQAFVAVQSADQWQDVLDHMYPTD